MALPKVNEVLKFNLTIPSTGQNVRYRPYLVKEEKVLLQAFESKDEVACINAMCDTLESCIDPADNIVVSQLATFDLEYMFLKVRSKSVGETSDILISCKDCNKQNDYAVDLELVDIQVNDNDYIVEITDAIKVEMKYPSYSAVISGDGIDTNSVDGALDLIAGCISAVHTEEERLDCNNIDKSEVLEFLGSMTASQLKGISSFVENMPALQHDIAFKCSKCGSDNELTLKGLTDFF
jgi:hypothetical protein